MKTKLFAESNPFTDLGAFAMEDLYCMEYVVTGAAIQMSLPCTVELHFDIRLNSQESCVTMAVANELLQVESTVNKYQSLSLTGKSK